MKKVLAALAVLTFLGCGSSRVYLNRDVMTVVVLAPLNESSDAEAPWKMWKYVEHEVASRGYKLVPHATVQAFYESKKYTGDPGQITEWSSEDLAKHFKADGVVWSNLLAWDKKTLGIYNSVEVKVEAVIRDREGAEVWKGQGEDGVSGTPSRKGILTSFVGTALADPEKYAPGAAANCFAGLPWAGWDPEAPRNPPAAK